MNVFLQLFWEFMKTGLFSVGGGYATLPFLYRMADNYPWFDRPMLVNMIAISGATPGPIGINMAVYAGYSAAGVLGGVVATLGVVFPAVVLVVLISRFLDKFQENKTVKAVFYGLRPAATGMIAAAGLGVMQLSLFSGKTGSLLAMLNYKAIALFAVLYFLLVKFKKHPIFYIAGAAAVGMLLQM